MSARQPAAPDHDPWATQPDPGRPIRQAMTVLAWAALALVLAGGVVGLSAKAPEGMTIQAWVNSGRSLPSQAWLGLGLIGAGLLAAVVVVWHGVRGAHERGRRLAIAAILVGGLAASPLLFTLIFYARGM